MCSVLFEEINKKTKIFRLKCVRAFCYSRIASKSRTRWTVAETDHGSRLDLIWARARKLSFWQHTRWPTVAPHDWWCPRISWRISGLAKWMAKRFPSEWPASWQLARPIASSPLPDAFSCVPFRVFRHHSRCSLRWKNTRLTRIAQWELTDN